MNISSQEALKLLLDGNHRFVNGLRSVETVVSTAKLRHLAEKGQSPFAVVLTCSDSRVPAEIVFDRGVGDLFVIRVAGNIVAPSIIGSIEFAAMSFGTPLCIVMGHSQCGAVKAAIASELDGKSDATPSLGKIVQKVRPAVRSALKTPGGESLSRDALLHASTLENIHRSAGLITKKSPILEGLVSQGKFMIASALYDLHTGRVEFDLPTNGLAKLDQNARFSQVRASISQSK